MKFETILSEDYQRRRRARFRYSRDLNLEKVNIKQQCDLWAKWQPLFWKDLNPKIYKDVDRFQDYRARAVFFAVNLWAAFDGIDEVFGEEQKQALVSASIGQNNDFPTYFVGRDLLEACLNTRPPDDIDWKAMNLPFEQITFIFERGALKVEDQELLFLQYTRARADAYELRAPGTKKAPLTIFLESDMFCINGITENFANYRRVFASPYSPQKDWKVLDSDPFDVKISAEETVFLETISNLVFNLIFVMKSRPILVESGRRVSFHKKQQTDIWTPHTIGVKYRIQRQRSASSASEPTGIKRRLHWRAGHTRLQNKGKVLNLGECECGDYFEKHSKLGVSCCLAVDRETQIACDCLEFRQAKRVFETQEPIWLEPILVGSED